MINILCPEIENWCWDARQISRFSYDAKLQERARCMTVDGEDRLSDLVTSRLAVKSFYSTLEYQLMSDFLKKILVVTNQGPIVTYTAM